ncbi:internalin [Listeria monocytogenes]|uniref:LapB repeat-containing protein n=1 Tax=Listeria monocytogenes TaxID=1639 RepID=UPI000D73AE2E|nr:LapB repeat-containing protein [Listeria monocytogenes]PXC44232.1 internalin [Listeria monocytogenes]
MKSKAKYIIIVGVVLFQSLVAYPLITMAEENDSKSVNIETTLEPKEVESTTSETEMEASTKEVVEEKTSQKSIITNNLTQEKSVLQAGETYESTFPDAALATVIAKAATGSEDITQEVSQTDLNKITSLTATSKGIVDLTGINLLSKLAYLSMSGNQISDISALNGLANLSNLNVSSNQITSFNLNANSNLPMLNTVDIRSNDLNNINVQDQSKLRTIKCDTGSSSELTEVMLKNLPTLIAASNSSNPVADDIAFSSTPGLSKVILENLPSTSSSVQLDRVINNLPKVSIVTINNNKITTLEGLEDLAALTSLNAGNNELTEIENMHTFPSLQTLNLSSNDLTNMVMNQATAEKFPLLRTMDIRSNNLIKIDIQNQSKLATIICDTGSSSELIEVTLKNLPELIAASNGSNQVKDDIAFLSTPGLSKVILENLPSTSSSVQLDRVINNLPKVSIVTINNNKITTLEGLEDLAALTSLNAGNNELTEIESMHAFPKLQTLTLISNKLTSIILNQATANGTPNLTSIDSRSNDLTKIDIQDQPKLTKIICDTGSSAELTELTLRNLPELIAASNGSNAVSDDIAFSATPGLSKVTLENLLATNVTIQLDHCVIEELVINNVPQVAFIYINNNKITTLEGLGNLTAVTNLNAENNELTELENIPAFPKLKTLTVNNNHISVLPTSLKTKNPVLTTLSATNQTITLKQKVIVSDLVLDNEVKNFGQTTTAKSISNNGTYQNNQVTWLFEDVQGVNAVDYQFSEPIQEATIQGTFSGKVTQPIKVSTVPVITADTEMTYPKNATISEAAFFKDISASVTDDAILTSDFESVVDFVKAGTYEVTLNAMNEDGVEAVSVTVLVHIAKSPAPVITADKEITYTQSTEVSTTEFLVAIHATTNDGSPIESDLDTTVNWSKVGDYTITLSATNEDGVEAIPVKVAVHIVEPPAPTISNVIFDVDGVQTTESHEVGELVSEPLTPTKEGYTFIGWYDEKTGGNKWDFTTDKMPGYNITLYAQFSKDTNKGEDGDGGKASVASSMEVTPSGQSQSENSKNSSNIKLPATGDDNATVLLVGLGLLMLGLFIRLTQKKHTK